MSTTRVRHNHPKHKAAPHKPTPVRPFRKAELEGDRLAQALGHTAREGGQRASWKVGPRPAELEDGDAFIVLAQGNDLVAIPVAHPSPRKSVPLTESEAAILSEGGFSPSGGAEKDRVEASAQAFASLLSESLSVAQAAEVLGVHQSRIRQKLGEGRRSLFGIKIRDEWVLPRFQFWEKGTVPGIEEVFTELDPDLHPVAVQRWFTTPNPDLEMDREGKVLSPLDWLRTGHPTAAVIELARTL